MPTTKDKNGNLVIEPGDGDVEDFMIDAATVYEETNLTPRELQEQRDRLKADLSIAQEKATQYDEEREKRWAVQQQRDELLGVLKKCAEQFRFYEQQHAAKDTDDGRVKAQLNANYAKTCELAIAKAKGENQ